MTAASGRICASDRLHDGGAGVRFTFETDQASIAAFVIRYRGQVYAYENACAHRQVGLDWIEGEFFDIDRTHLICATHGARYDPATGACVAGPCAGRGLRTVAVHERDGWVYAGMPPAND